VTPRFPDGLSVIDVAGQFRSSTGIIVREPSKLLVILAPDAAAVADEIGQVIRIYKRRFDQARVYWDGRVPLMTVRYAGEA
jgi:hypothetical protein